MTMDEKLQFIADRIKDEKEFSIDGEDDTYRFRNFKLKYVRRDRTDDYSQVSLNFLLLSPLKLKPQWEFTEDEKAILRNLPEQYKWIARDDVCDGLFAYTLKPTKFEHNWVCMGNLINLTGFRHLFQSIKWTDDEPFEFRRYL